jgi:hypothetical protein
MRAEREKKRPKKKKPAKPQIDKIVTNGFTERPPAHKLGCRCYDCVLVGATREPI